ncbi:MAG: universal stress protein [Candidatus Nanopelagicales bacterium]
MTVKSRVLVGVDASGSSDHAVQWGAAEALQRTVPLVLLHAVSPTAINLQGPVVAVSATELQAAAEKMLSRIRDNLCESNPGLEVEVVLTRSSATDALLEHAGHSSMIVVGSQRLGTISQVFLGSTSHQLAARASVPVAVVRRLPTNGAAPIAVGVDGSEHSQPAIEVALTLAQLHQVDVVAVGAWVADVPLGYGIWTLDGSMLTDLRAAAQARLSEALAGWEEKFPDVTIHQRVVHAHPVDALAEVAAISQALVVGSHGRGLLRTMLLGSVSSNLLHLLDTPVIVAHS